MDWLQAYLDEDRADRDITSQAIFEAGSVGQARIVARSRGVLAGSQVAAEVFSRCDCQIELHMNDGSLIDAGACVMTVKGPVRGLLAGERLALNILGRMSGIATQTRQLVEALATECSGAVVAGSRKTTPGFRIFEKQAIVVGGGVPHRMDLEEEAMIKDNHREAAGDVASAVQRVKTAFPDKILTTEVETLDDAMAAAAAGSEWIMIDNQSPDVGRAWAEAVWADHPEVKIEASGGITPANVTDYGWADRISLGWLTHQARSLDFGMDWGAP